MKLFLDANIIVSVLNKEYPLFSYSSRVLSLADQKGFHVFTSPLCLAIAWYFVEKKSGARVAKQKMELLLQNLKITTVDEQVVQQAINNKKVKDFEDGMEYYSALKQKCDYIITEDINDFYFADVDVMKSELFLQHLSKLNKR